jgi:hypothetical protein
MGRPAGPFAARSGLQALRYPALLEKSFAGRT